MPWKESHQMDERIKFVSRLLDGERMVDLCREFGISRKTGYKFRDRYASEGILGLENARRGPRNAPHKTSPELTNLVIKLREDKPTWGAKKIAARLKKVYPDLQIPAASTVGEILKREGYINQRLKRKRPINESKNLFVESRKPNEFWCIDYKGHFRMGNRQYCYPLTVSDHCSRYLLGCEALSSTQTKEALPALERIFKEYGLPEAIISDNGSPFASPGLCRLSRLSVWLMRLGIKPLLIKPGHPEQNGRHERMHLTLKREATRPAGKNLLQQQEKFDVFRESFNLIRPHEALNMETPSEIYTSSLRAYPKKLPEPDYSLCDTQRKVSIVGSIRLPIKGTPMCFVGRALQGQHVGLTQLNDTQWRVQFTDLTLGYINKNESKYLITADKETVT